MAGILSIQILCLLSLNSVRGLTEVTEDILVDSTFYKNLGPYVFKKPVTIKSGATLTIQAGTEIQINLGSSERYSYAIKVEGTLNVQGNQAEIVQFTVAASCDRQCKAIDTHTGRTDITYASFKRFDNPISLRCCHEGSTVIQDTLFEENLIAVSGYRGTMTDLKRCTFRRNDRAITSADKYLEDCVLEDNVQCAICGVERTRLFGCTIKGHRGIDTKVIAMSGRFSSVKQCVITNNDIGIRSYEGTFEGNLITANDVGFYFPETSDTSFPTMSDNNICGNTEWNVQYSNGEDWYTSGNWFGSSDERLVRGYIEDGYHASGRGRVMFGTLPTSRISNAAGSDLSCPAPPDKPDFTLDGAWKVGNIFEDREFGAGETIIENPTTIYPGVKLTIKAGARIVSKAAITVKGAKKEDGSRIFGTLDIQGTDENPVTFAGPLSSSVTDGSSSYMEAIDADLGTTKISHAVFEYFPTVISLRCCESGPTVQVTDTEFSNNNQVVGGYMGHYATFKRCSFINNKFCFSSADYEIEDSTFDNNDCALCGVERTIARRTVFKNHKQYAISGRGPEISDCLIENNPLGYRAGDGGFSFKRNVFNNNGVAMDLSNNPGTIQENNLCNSNQWNVFYRNDAGLSLENNYWGEPSGDLNLIRSGIRDAYHDSQMGLISLGTIKTTPFSNHYSTPNPCNAPSVLSNFTIGQSGGIFGDTMWSGTVQVTELTTIHPGATLTILAGTTVILNNVLKVKGTLKVEGTAESMVVFEPAAGASSGAYLNGDDGVSHIKFARFQNFQTAITVTCCHKGEMSFSDSIFNNNDLVHSGYMGSVSKTTFIRCRFEKNKRCLTNADKIIEDSVFDSNDCALCGVERMVVHRCIFKYHKQYAVSGRGPEITDSVFIGNQIAYQYTGDGGFVFERNVVTGGIVGVIATSSNPSIRENNICGNIQSNIEVKGEFDLDIGCNFLGVGNQVSARGKIQDGWKTKGVGTAIMERIALAPYNLGQLVPEAYETHPCISKPCDPSLNCSDHGMCAADGTCVCLPGWSGQYCQICHLGLIPSPLGERCAKSCDQFGFCTQCLSSTSCGWCVGSGCVSMVDFDTSRCSAITQDFCSSDPFGISSSKFERTGTTVAVKFNAPTEFGSTSAGRFDCSLLLSFDATQSLGNGQECQRISERQLNIYMGPGFRLRPNGIIQQQNTTLSFRAGLVKKRGTEERLRREVFEVEPPERIPQPKAIVKAPTFSGVCADLVLDGSLSTDPTGKMSTMWKLTSQDQTDIDKYLRYLHCGCTGSSCDNIFRNDGGKNYDCSVPESDQTLCQAFKSGSGLKLVVPRKFLSYGEQLQFQLHVSNILGLQSKSDIINVTVSEKPQLTVRMLTPTLIVRRRKLVEIKLSVHLPDCGYEIPPRPTLEYDWEWSNTSLEEVDPQLGRVQSGVVPRKTSLFVLPYSLSFDTSVVYFFNATVTDRSGNYEGSTVSAKVTVVKEPLQLFIAGNNAVINFKSNISLTAKAFDPMANEDDEKGTFKWKCFQILDDGSKVQSFDVSGFSETNILLTSSAQGFPVGNFEFHLKWKKEFRETHTSISVRITDSTSAEIQILRPRNVLVTDQRLYIGKGEILHLRANNVPLNSTIVWFLNKVNDRDDLLETFDDYLLTELLNSSDLILQAAAFEEGIDYRFSLRVESNETNPSESYLTVAVPVSPKGGYLSVEPCQSGAHAFSTNFQIDARDWMLVGQDESDLQLEYYFGYNVGDTTVYLSASYSAANEVITKLPQGTVELWVKIRSPSGGETKAVLTCQVQAPPSGVNDQQVIENTLDNTEEAEHTITTAAMQTRSSRPSNQALEDNKNRWLRIKSTGMEQRLGIPIEADEIHKCMSDMAHILGAGDPEILNTADVPVADEIISDCAQFASSGIEKDTAEVSFEAIGSLSSVEGASTAALRKRRKRDTSNTDIHTTIYQIHRGTAEVLVPRAKPITLHSAGLQSVVVRDFGNSLTGRKFSDVKNGLFLETSHVLAAADDESVDVYVTFWGAGHHHLVCKDCSDLAADLVATSIHETNSQKNLLETSVSQGTTKYRVKLHERAKTDGLQCVQSDDTVSWTGSSCNQPTIDGTYIECQCVGFAKYYTANGNLSPKSDANRAHGIVVVVLLFAFLSLW